jgi:hypothetical protein
MAGTLHLYDPTAPRHEDGGTVSRSLSGLAGKVVGFVDNAKPNFDHLVDDLAELLVSKYGVSRVIKRKKRSASVPAPDAMIEELTGQCDLVITGSGD